MQCTLTQKRVLTTFRTISLPSAECQKQAEANSLQKKTSHPLQNPITQSCQKSLTFGLTILIPMKMRKPTMPSLTVSTAVNVELSRTVTQHLQRPTNRKQTDVSTTPGNM